MFGRILPFCQQSGKYFRHLSKRVTCSVIVYYKSIHSDVFLCYSFKLYIIASFLTFNIYIYIYTVYAYTFHVFTEKTIFIFFAQTTALIFLLLSLWIQLYTNCRCISGSQSNARPAPCPNNCPHFLLPVMLVISLASLIACLTHNPMYMMVLR